MVSSASLIVQIVVRRAKTSPHRSGLLSVFKSHAREPARSICLEPGGLRSFLIPHSTNQSGFLNIAVGGNKRQARDSGLCDNETIIGIWK